MREVFSTSLLTCLKSDILSLMSRRSGLKAAANSAAAAATIAFHPALSDLTITSMASGLNRSLFLIRSTLAICNTPDDRTQHDDQHALSIE